MTEAVTVLAAVDLGASSGRVMIGQAAAAGFTLSEVGRFPNRPRRLDGVLRWDSRALLAGMINGLRAAAAGAGRLDSVSVDGWAVDYALLDDEGGLIADPASYRDARTAQPFAAVTRTRGGVAGVDAASLYEVTGITAQPFNTIFQLMAERQSEQILKARHALLVPDLMTYLLSGQMSTELTNASTTQLLDPRRMRWATGVAADLGVPVDLFPRLREAGELAGPMAPLVVADLGLDRPPQVVIGPSHDTAAAVVGVPAEDDAFAFVCTGTWALAGLELPAPVITDAGRAARFSNEVGVDGTIRFLRNVTGFWLLQECIREWESAGRRVDLEELTVAAGQVPGGRALIDVQDPDFAAPGRMTERITRACRRISGIELSGHAEILRCILDSMATAIRHAIRDAAQVTSRQVRTVHVVGGGAANPLFCELVADACQLPVVAGPTEAASWGNVLVQARALGALRGSLAELRGVIRRATILTAYQPRNPEEAWQVADQIVLSSRATVP